MVAGFNVSPGTSAEDLAYRRRLAAQLAQQGSDTSPVGHWTQGLARALQGGVAGLEMRGLRDEERAQNAQTSELLMGLPGLSTGASTPPAQAPASAPGARYADAIASIESGGKYDALGPMTKTGDRAHGKYQVMGANIGPWSREALGRALSPEQFIADPKAQDAVFNHRFGQYANKYGPEGAAKAWFAGEGGMNNPNAKDQLGTTVSGYAQKFANALGPQVAQAGGPQIDPQSAQQIRALLSNPNTRAYGMKLYEQATAGNKPTDEMREYELAKRQGFDGSFIEFKTQLKQAGATKINNVVGQGESEFAKTAGKKQAERFDEIIQGGHNAKEMAGDITALREIGGRITTGKTAEIAAAIGPYAEALGVKVDGLDDMQAYKAIVSKLAPRMRVPGSGATSDFEMRTFLEALPGLGKTPGGNEIIANTLEAIQQSKIQASEIASRAINREITPAEADKLLREMPDPLTLWKQSRKASPAAKPGSAAAPTGVDPKIWEHMTPEERSLWK